MRARAGEAVIETARDAAFGPIEMLLIARIACDGGATRSELTRDLSPLLQHKLSPGEIRSAIETGVGAILDLEFARETRGRLSATERGADAAAHFLETAPATAATATWEGVRDIALVAKALGLGLEPQSRKNALARPEGLRTLILQKTYRLKGKKNIPDAKLRAQLALVALERAFGNKIKTGFTKGSGLPSKAARTLAGQLAASPREFPTDAKLIAQLAADAVGAAQADPDVVRLAVVRRMVSQLLDAAQPAARAAKATPSAPVAPARLVDNPANDTKPANGPPPRPGLEEFAASVKRAAAKFAQGWPPKALISHVWDRIRIEHEVWALSEIEFKSMLTEAHRRGAIALVTADLKNLNRQEIERSATPDRNTIWHYVRIED
jgi:hypothetical protein